MFKAFIQNQPYFRLNITYKFFQHFFILFWSTTVSFSLPPSLSPDIIYILQKRYIYLQNRAEYIIFKKKGMFNIILIKELNKLGLTCIFCTRVIYRNNKNIKHMFTIINILNRTNYT